MMLLIKLVGHFICDRQDSDYMESPERRSSLKEPVYKCRNAAAYLPDGCVARGRACSCRPCAFQPRARLSASALAHHGRLAHSFHLRHRKHTLL